MTKAKLKALDPPGGEVEFQYNPTKFSVNKSVSWTPGKQKGTDAPPLDFEKGEGRAIAMELFMDDYEEGANVYDRVKKLEDFTRVSQGNAKNSDKPRPPRVLFMWGGKHAEFPSIIKSLNVTYTMFHEDGRPARATVNLTLQEIGEKKQGQNPTSMGSAGMRTRRVIAGDTLDNIAFEELGNSSHWQKIAELNNIDNPLSIRPGQHLVIAPLR